jgi:hypothetical protein
MLQSTARSGELRYRAVLQALEIAGSAAQIAVDLEVQLATAPAKINQLV